MKSQMKRYVGEIWECHESRSFSPMECRGCDSPSQHVDVFTDVETLSTFGSFMEASSYRHDQLLTPFPAPLWRTGGWAENSTLIVAWSFW